MAEQKSSIMAEPKSNITAEQKSSIIAEQKSNITAEQKSSIMAEQKSNIMAEEFSLAVRHSRSWRRSAETLSGSGPTSHLISASSRSSQSLNTLYDESFAPITEEKYPLDGWVPLDPRLTVFEEDDGKPTYREKRASSQPYSPLASPCPIDEEANVGFNETPRYSTTDNFTNLSALTLTGNLLLEKAAEDTSIPVPLADPSADLTDDLPKKIGVRAYRYIRWNFFSAYRRLFTVIFAANMAVLVALLCRRSGADFTYNSTLDAASANLLLAILMRNEHVINVLFWLSSALPRSTPLLLRRWAAKIYTYGGVHSGCSVAALTWYIAFTGLATTHGNSDDATKATKPAVVALSYIVLSLLVLIAVFAHPNLRTKLHDYFEATHRFAGWTAVALFWAQTILVAHYTAFASQNTTHTTTLARALSTSPPFYCLVVITLCLIYPWTRLRLHTPLIEPLSPHAVRLHFTHTNLSYCQGIRLTDAPLKETHAFAGIPNPPGVPTDSSSPKGFSVVISNAGDWTKKIIQNPPRRIYLKGAPVYGVLRVAAVFSPVVIVATGSGIGPCLSLFNARTHPPGAIRVLWSTPSPLLTYGQGVIDGVLAADPDAVIVDTRAGPVGEDGKRTSSRPDMVRLTWKLWRECKAEAVVVISNPKVTRKVVYGMETRGVPAFGPIWDS